MIDVQARIERAELTGRLEQGLRRGSVVLVADAGFGKTTALEQALGGGDRAAVWLRAGEADRDPGRFLDRLVARIRGRLPGVGDDLAERMASALQPLDPTAVAEDLVEELERLLVDPLVIVIDDAERLEGASSLAILDTLLSSDALRIALCSRKPLGLRLAKLRGTGRLLELGSADLVFSPAECAQCLRAVRGSEPSSEETEDVYTLTEGWPLGVGLAAAVEPRAAAGGSSRQAIFAYLAEEVLDGLPTELRERLCTASLVDELDPALEDALGLPESFRDELRSHGLFVRADEGDRYAIHPLLREFLRERLHASRDPASVSELHVRAADALMSADRVPEAIDHLFDAREFGRAGDAMALYGVRLAGTAPGTVAAWLAELPDDVASRPMLRLVAGHLAMGRGDFDVAVEQCRSAVDSLERDGAPPVLTWAARFALTEALLAALDLDAAAEVSAGAHDAGPDAGPAALICALTHAALLDRMGRREESERIIDQVVAREGARELLGPWLNVHQARYRDHPAGRLDEALENIDAAVGQLRSADPFNRLPYVLVFKMAIHEARGEREAALETFTDLVDSARRTGLAGYVGAGARLAAATILLLEDRPEEAHVQLQRVDREWSSWAGCDSEVARALLAGRAGDHPAVLARARRAFAEADRMPALDRVRPASVLAPVLCDSGHAETARGAVEAVLDAQLPGDSTARARAALSCVLFRIGDRSAAHAELRASFEEAGENARFVVRSEWPQIEPVIWSALDSQAVEPGPVISALDAAFPGGVEIVRFLDHPNAEAREAALRAAASAGRPEALTRISGAPEDDGIAAEVRIRLRERPPALALRTLGRFEVRRGRWVAEAASWERKVAERVVRLLLLRAGEFVPEDEIFEAFWPDKDPVAARRGLQTAISSARKVLDLPWEPSRIEADERAYALVLRAGDSLDSAAFESAADRALAARGPERIPALEAADRIWAGEPLPEERYSDWAAAWRERLSSIRGDVLAALAEAHGELGDHAAAVRAARALVDLDPLDEHSQRLLIGAYAAAGRRGDALRQYLECRRALIDELGIEPDAETTALQRRVLAGTA